MKKLMKLTKVTGKMSDCTVTWYFKIKCAHFAFEAVVLVDRYKRTLAFALEKLANHPKLAKWLTLILTW